MSLKVLLILFVCRCYIASGSKYCIERNSIGVKLLWSINETDSLAMENSLSIDKSIVQIQRALQGPETTNFQIDNNTRMIEIIVSGNASRAILEIPGPVTVSYVRNKIRITDPAPGVWNLTILGVEFYNYAITAGKTVESNNERTHERILEQPDSREQQLFGTRDVRINVNPESQLYYQPGTVHRILFDVKNNNPLIALYHFQVKSSPFRTRLRGPVQPVQEFIWPGQTIQVWADVEIPNYVSQETVNLLTLYVQGSEITSKSTYMYMESIKVKNDNYQPVVDYYFNNNCAGRLSKEKCGKSYWSVDIIVQDYDSGLKYVNATPNDLYSNPNFISGTKYPTNFYYTSNCCSTTVKITALDLRDNNYVRTIDVNEWNNLSQGEIASIVLGSLLLLLIITIIIITITYCVRRKKSEDLPFTQRYGSRRGGPARAERTSF